MSKVKKLVVGLPAFAMSLFLFAQASPTFAATGSQVTAPVTDEAGLQALLCNVIAWTFWVIIVVSVIMVLWAAYDYVTAGDDTEKTTRGRKRLTYAAVGIAIAILAAGVPSIISDFFPNDPGTNLMDTCTAL
jgi:heme/copper-type cytochrome/quinol oxidase subunit 2